MSRRGVLLPLAAGILTFGILVLGRAGAQADEGKTVDCSEITLKFDAPGYKVTCKDESDSSVSVGELNAGIAASTLHAFSATEITFLDAVDEHVLGGTRIYITRRTLQSDIEHFYSGSFSDWGAENDLGGFEVEHVTAKFSGDPVECLAFRKLGGRRREGVSGLTAGIVCSMQGRDHAMEALKHFSGGGS